MINNKFYLVLDTNVIYQDFWMQGEAFQYLRSHVFAGHSLIIPEVVMDETVNHFSKLAENALARAKRKTSEKSIGAFQRIYGLGAIPEHSDSKLAVKRYRSLLEQVIADSNGFVAQTPSISQSIIYKRSLEGKKPFSASGDKGYRDTLIWFTLLDLFDDNTYITFITNNSGDFCADNSNELHADLIEDVRQKVPISHLKIQRSLDEFISSIDSDGEASAQAFVRALISGGFHGFDLWNWVEKNLIDLLPDDEQGDPNWAGLAWAAENPLLREIEEIVSLDIPRSKMVAANIVRISCDFALVGHYEVDVFFYSWRNSISKKQMIDEWYDFDESRYYQSPLIRTVGTYILIMDFDLKQRHPVKVEVRCLNHWSKYPEAYFSDEVEE